MPFVTVAFVFFIVKLLYNRIGMSVGTSVFNETFPDF